MVIMLKPKDLKINVRIVYTLFSFAAILGGTLAAIQYANGNWRMTRQGVVRGTGLLSANSHPNGAQIKIDGKLVSATNDTLYLQPGQYSVDLVKEGFSTWHKDLRIQEELVTQTNARLFPLNPSLIPLTYTGVEAVSPSPDGQKLLYYTASASAQIKNGLYILELGDNLLSIAKDARQIASDTSGNFNFRESRIIWSPDSSQVLVISPYKEVVLDLNKNTDVASLPDNIYQQSQLLSQWQEEMYIRERQFLSKFPPALIEIATSSAKNVYFSPDKNKIVYTATAAAVIPDGLVPPLPSINTQPEERNLIPNNIYIYDREEDRNFLIGTESLEATGSGKALLATDLYNRQPLSQQASPSAFVSLQGSSSAQTAANFRQYHSPLYTTGFQWFPNSGHLVYSLKDRIQIKEYDNTNDTTVYFGPFLHSFVYPWPDGGRLVILTSFSPDIPPNLYSVELK